MWFSPCSFLMFSVRNCSNSTCGAVLAQYLLLGYAWICWDLTPRFDMSSGHPAFHIVELFAFSRCLWGRMVLFAFYIHLYTTPLHDEGSTFACHLSEPSFGMLSANAHRGQACGSVTDASVVHAPCDHVYHATCLGHWANLSLGQIPKFHPRLLCGWAKGKSHFK
jgi:hypothetical protein